MKMVLKTGFILFNAKYDVFSNVGVKCGVDMFSCITSAALNYSITPLKTNGK